MNEVESRKREGIGQENRIEGGKGKSQVGLAGELEWWETLRGRCRKEGWSPSNCWQASIWRMNLKAISVQSVGGWKQHARKKKQRHGERWSVCSCFLHSFRIWTLRHTDDTKCMHTHKKQHTLSGLACRSEVKGQCQTVTHPRSYYQPLPSLPVSVLSKCLCLSLNVCPYMYQYHCCPACR